MPTVQSPEIILLHPKSKMTCEGEKDREEKRKKDREGKRERKKYRER